MAHSHRIRQAKISFIDPLVGKFIPFLSLISIRSSWYSLSKYLVDQLQLEASALNKHKLT